MSSSIDYPFTIDSNYTFDNTLVEIAGGVANLKDKTPADSLFYANFNTNADGNWGYGTLTGTLGGAATVIGGELDLTGGNATCEHNSDNLATMLNEGCIRFRWKPNYTGSVSPAQELFFNNTTSSNRIEIVHTSATLQVYVYNSTGALIFSMVASFSPVGGTTYEIELNFDLITGTHRLFVNGVIKSQISAKTGTRNAGNTLQIGDAVGQNFYIDDIMVFNTVQHTANYTPNWSTIPDTRYDITNPTVITNASFRHEGIDDFTETSTIAGSDNIKYQLSKDGVYYYWNGTAWAVSDGSYTQSNTVAEIIANKSTFTADVITTQIKILLHSNDGNTTPEINNLTILYDYAGETPDVVSKCNVWGYYRNDRDGAVDNQPFQVYLNNDVVKYKTNITIRKTKNSVTPKSSNGYWEIELVETENMLTMDGEVVKYVFDFGDEKAIRKVPDATSKMFYDLGK